MIDLLILLAHQVGKEVSHHELATPLSMSKNSVEKYLDLLEQVFVLVNLRGFSRNLRKEVTKTSKYFFYDNGIRNALINHYNPLPLRDDVGILWENYLVMERIKKQHVKQILSHNYFWRTYDQKEIDWIEEREGSLYGFEFKWEKPLSKLLSYGLKPIQMPPLNALIQTITWNLLLKPTGYISLSLCPPCLCVSRFYSSFLFRSLRQQMRWFEAKP